VVFAVGAVLDFAVTIQSSSVNWNKEGYSKGSVWSRLVNACGLSM
jgi:hypothetical protein